MTNPQLYNFGEYSLFDIQSFLQARGYVTRFEFAENPAYSDKMLIEGTDVTVDIPRRDINGLIGPHISLAPDSRAQFDFEANKKLFASLKRKFGLKNSELVPKHLKDEDKIKLLYEK